jgi:serine/threonine-protein kinase
VADLDILGKQVLGRYTVRERIASGGMSVLYRAQDERLQRPVCVKVFFGLDRSRPEYEVAYEHFVQEAFALSQLQHPNTIRIYDFGYLDEEPRSPFYVCELMNGGTLQNKIRQDGALSPRQTLSILEPVIQALSEAHGRGIVHRDIKPSNILFATVGPRSIPKLADFGIAKAAAPGESDASLPYRAPETYADGRRFVFCSPSWAAPEQLRAQPVGPSADIFSMGLVLAFAVSGKKIYSEDNMAETLSNRINGDEYVTRVVGALSIPKPIAREVLRACSAKPESRHRSAEELLDALRVSVAESKTARSDTFDNLRTEMSPEPKTQPDEKPKLPTASVPERGPGSTVGKPVLVLARLSEREVIAAGRRVRLARMADSIELGGEEPNLLQSPGKVRLTFLPNPGANVRVHLKGLNCFVAKSGGRQTNACTVDEDAEIELRVPGKGRLDAVRCQFGLAGAAGTRVFPVGGAVLGIPLAEAPYSVLLDFGPGRDLVLVYSIPPSASGSLEA